MAHGIAISLTLIDVLSIGAGAVLLGAGSSIWWRTERAGRALLTLRRPTYAWLYTALAGVFVAIFLARLLNPHLRQPSLIFLNLAWIAFCLAYLANRPRVRERGIIVGARFLPWGRIVSYSIGAARDGDREGPDTLLTVYYDPAPAPAREARSLVIRCATGKRRDIELLLARHVRTEQGHRRWQACRVEVPGPAAVIPAVALRRARKPPSSQARRPGVAKGAARRQAVRPAH